MPVYQYNAVTLDGAKKSGTMEAESPERLTEKLREQNLYVSDFKEKSSGSVAKSKKLKPMELADMCRQLGTMVGSGVVIVRAVNIIMNRQGLDPKLKEAFGALHGDLKQGYSLSEAMEAQNGAFPQMLINMIKAGEASGTMDQTLMKMAEHYEKEERLNSKIKSAMNYPKILGFITIIVIIILFVFVLPQFFDLFESQGAELPMMTQLMVNFSNFLTQKWYIYVPIIAVLVLGFNILKKEPGFILAWDKFKVNMPKIGPLMKIIYTARFARTISSLYASGIPLVDCLVIAKGTIGNVYISDQIEDLVREVKGGATVSEVIAKVDGFDSKLSATILIGEETGKLDDMLNSTADAFDYEADEATGRLTAYIEPVMLVIMAVTVGAVVISVIQPIYGMYDTIGGM